MKRTNDDQFERTVESEYKQMLSNQTKNLYRNQTATTVAKSEIDGTMEQLKPRRSNVKYPVLPPRANVNQAITLQIEANNLLKHIISQNNKQIQLLNELVKILSNKNE